ncbi:phospholipid carrier-dependent glycosyltransferase [Verrucomicrobia bacterium S94]|nr:phospholipid carrier-dependent glycosyltransferase [Verrucomicrobia bacterium S94]
MADNRSFESTLHDIVYSIDTGTGLKIIRVSLYILLLLVIVMVFTATQFRGLKSAEAMDLCQLGRNISLENGLVTKNVRPLSMHIMEQQTPDENPMIKLHPDLYNAPAYPAVLSLGFNFFELIGVDPFEVPEGNQAALLPAEQWVVLPVNHLFSILTGVLVFLLGKRMFSREIGFLGMTIYYLSNLVWLDSVSGLNISMAVFFSVLSFHQMVVSMLNKRDGDRKHRWILPFLLSIVSAVIAFYTRFITAAIVPGSVCLHG